MIKINDYFRVQGRIDQVVSIEKISIPIKGSKNWNEERYIIHGFKYKFDLEDIEDYNERLIELVKLGDLVNERIVIGINRNSGDNSVDSIYTDRFIFNNDIEWIVPYQYLEYGRFDVKKKED